MLSCNTELWTLQLLDKRAWSPTYIKPLPGLRNAGPQCRSTISFCFNFLVAISNEHFGLQLVVSHKRGNVKYSLNTSKYRINTTIKIFSEYCFSHWGLL